MGWTIGRQTSKQYGIPKGLPYLTGFVIHREIARDLVGILIFFRVWRFVRIGHGFIASTFELQEEKLEKWKEYIRDVEKVVNDLGGKLPDTRPSSLLEEEQNSD